MSTLGFCVVALAIVVVEGALSVPEACIAGASGPDAELASPTSRLVCLLSLEAYMEASLG
jgi:hypothetical protein